MIILFTFLLMFCTYAMDIKCILEAHQAINTDLYNGHLVDIKPFSKNSNRNEIFKVSVFNPQSGRTRDGIFKPRYWGDGDGWNRVTMEYAAYEVARILDVDTIPPVAYRRNFGHNEYHFDEGALLYHVPDSHQLKNVLYESWDSGRIYKRLDRDLFFSDTRILDVLMQNPDRHIDNFMRGQHWVDGVYRPVLIDQAASLRRLDNSITLTAQDAFNNHAISIIRKGTFDKLKKLNYDELKKMDEFLSEEEIQYILRKKEEILEYFNNLIRLKGEENVIYDASFYN